MKASAMAVCLLCVFIVNDLFSEERKNIATTSSIPDMPAKLAQARGGLGNVLEKLQAGKTVTIAYFGTSISNSKWCEKNAAWFRASYPKAEIKEVKAAIGATGSSLGVFRVVDHVLKYRPDLIFVEFSINDDGRPQADVCRDVEGIVRQAWKADPQTDICLVHMFRPGYAPSLRSGKCTKSQTAHEVVADYYGIPSINPALRINELVDAGKLLLSAPKDAADKPAGMMVYSIGDGVHPVDGGVKAIVDAAAEALTAIFATSKPGAHQLKPPYIPENPMENAKLAPLDQRMLSSGWVKLDDVSNRFGRLFAQDGGGQYKMSGVWEAHQPGESIKFRFKGTKIGLYDVRAPDAGQVTVAIDGKAIESPGGIYGFARCNSNVWPCCLFIAENLENKEHGIEIKISSQAPDRRALIESESKKTGFNPKTYEGTFIRVARILVVGDVSE